MGFLLLLLFSHLLFYHHGCSKNITPDSLDAVIRDQAFRALVHRRTGVVYDVPLSADLSGIEASVLRVRGRSLWVSGADVGPFRIPPMTTITVPPVRRLALVYQDLGNWSFVYHQSVPGHELVAPVVGLLAYDASNVSSDSMTEIELGVMAGDSISISFPSSSKWLNGTTTKCARFGSIGSASIGDTPSSSSCLTTGTGHFAVVVPSDVSAPPVVVVVKGGGRRWMGWVIVGGVVGLVLVVGLVGVGLWKVRRMRRMEGMERNADDGEGLGTVWVGESRIPSATMMRTQPTIEN